MEGNEIPNGWPLGLGNMNSRIIRVVGVAAPLHHAASRPRRSSSFSSFSSSNLDTESTASFFPDQSVSLGRLIGIEPSNTGRKECGNEGNNVGDRERSHHVGVGVPKTDAHNSADGLCAALLHHVIGRIARSQTTSRHHH